MLNRQNFYTIGILSSFLFLLSIAYWPAVSMRYVYHDSLIFFLDTDVRLWPPGTLFSFVSGRYLGAAFLVIIGRLITRLEDLQILRFFTIVQLSFCGLLLVNFLRRHFLRFTESFLVVLIALTLPAFQIIVCQGGMAFYPFSLLAAFGSFALCFHAPVPKDFLSYCSLRHFGAIVLMAVSLSIYQSGAMFFWTLAAAFVLFASKETFSDLWRKAFHIVFTGFLGMAFYRLILEFTKSFSLRYNPFQNYSPYLLADNLFVKVRWFWTGPLTKVLNAWNIMPVKEYAYFFFVFVAGAILLTLLDDEKKGHFPSRFKQRIMAFVLTSVFFFLTSLPNLLFVENISFYRCYMALSVSCTLLFFWALSKYAALFPRWGRRLGVFVLLALAGAGIAQAHHTIKQYRARPSAEELRFLEESIQDVDLNRFARVYFIQPNQERLYTSDDEYGNLTTHFGNDIIGFFSCGIIGQMKSEYSIYHINYAPTTGKTIYFFKKEEEDKPNYSYQVMLDFGLQPKTSADFSEPTFIIDMNKVVDRLVKRAP